jgi:aspartyl-tRNA(Asn)/glutamyl-tRNA(Gln) amidotransferase subunit C
MISRQEVEHVAHLARLHLSADELVRITEQLTTILAYVDTLATVNTDKVAPTTHAAASTTAFRDDVVRASLPLETALANAPARDEQNFIVPRVI